MTATRRSAGEILLSSGESTLSGKVPSFYPSPFSSLRGRFLVVGLASLLGLAAGCRQDMHDQPKFVPQRGTTFFSDGRSVRPQVEHTVAREQAGADDYLNTGLIDGKEQDLAPFPVTMQVLERGQERYNIYCSPCHSRVGNGDGMIVQRGYKPAGNLHDAQRLASPLGHFFFVMTNGYGAMPDYAAQLTPEDRWAVAIYIRALQMSQNARAADAPAGTQVENLGDIAQREGLPASFAEPWTLPTSTAVSAKPLDQSQGNPGNAPGDTTAPAIWQNPPQAVPPNGQAQPNGNVAPRAGAPAAAKSGGR